MNIKIDNGSDVYIYGMTVLSTIHLLNGPYPDADTYQDIKETHIIPGGEAGNSAIILANLGYEVKIDGPYLGVKTKDGITGFLGKLNIDCSNLYTDMTYDGVQDSVLVAENSRTVFGRFTDYFNNGSKRWTKPDRSAIRSTKIVALDPFFQEESQLVAQYCAEEGKKYVTIDCDPESVIFKNAAAAVISAEYIKDNFKDINIKELYDRYINASDGLVIFTFGSREILYGRKGQEVKKFVPYKVDVKSTLGAGDTFRAGVVYGVLNCMSDDNIIKFAAATAASVCKRFPMAMDPPGLDEIMELVNLK